MATTFLNGAFVDTSDARVGAFDAGMQHGVGLFETMTGVVARSGAKAQTREDLSANYRVVHLREHMARLVSAAAELGLSDSLQRDALGEAVERTLAKASESQADVQRFRLRLTITGGDLNMLSQARGNGAEPAGNEAVRQREQLPTVLIHAQPATQYPRELFERGVGVVVGEMKVNPLNPFEGHKTLNYWPRLRTLQLAASVGASEALIFQVTNYLAGGCVSNALLVKDGRIVTPFACGERAPDSSTLASPVLAGVTRRWAIEWCEENGIDIVRKLVTIDDVLSADELLLTNSSWGVLPVVRVERREVGPGLVGAVGKQLIAAWERMIGS